MFSRTRIIATITAATVIASLGAASAQAATSSPSPKATAKVAAGLPKLPTAPVVRIGFFANVTHAPALVAQQLRLFENQLGKQGTQVQYAVFNAGPAEVEALKAQVSALEAQTFNRRHLAADRFRRDQRWRGIRDQAQHQHGR